VILGYTTGAALDDLFQGIRGRGTACRHQEPRLGQGGKIFTRPSPVLAHSSARAGSLGARRCRGPGGNARRLSGRSRAVDVVARGALQPNMSIRRPPVILVYS